ncbi:MAG: hypothetical protein AAF197_08110 [Pseudomonadota bacterium]
MNLSQAVRFAIQEIAVGPDRGRNIDFELAKQVTLGILQGQVDEVQAAVFLIAMRMKRESSEEMRGMVSAAQDCIETVNVPIDGLLTIAEPFDGYARTVSISAFFPAVLSACGIPTLIHGVRSVGPKHGVTPHQVYELANVAVADDPARAAIRIVDAGWAYLDQARYLPALHTLVELREKIIKRTALTTFERVLRPLSARSNNTLALGYVHKAYPQVYAAIAKEVGYEQIVLSKGVEGGLTIAANKPFATYQVDLRGDEIDLQRSNYASLKSSKEVVPYDQNSDTSLLSKQCYESGLEVLQGKHNGTRQSLLNACVNIMVLSKGMDQQVAIEKVETCLDNGSALATFLANSV